MILSVPSESFLATPTNPKIKSLNKTNNIRHANTQKAKNDIIYTKENESITANLYKSLEKEKTFNKGLEKYRIYNYQEDYCFNYENNKVNTNLPIGNYTISEKEFNNNSYIVAKRNVLFYQDENNSLILVDQNESFLL